MMECKITPVIMCGGSGTRLWPLSRKSYPKQFAPLAGDMTLFQQAALRVNRAGFETPIVLSNADFRFIVTQQLADAGLDSGPVLIEPAMRNTAPALLAAALFVAQTDPKKLMLAMPSDHLIPDGAQFCALVQRGIEAARAGRIVTFGIAPDRPETGYGYLELDGAGSDRVPVPLLGFVEKPDAAAAQAMLEAGHFLWNAGIFLYTAETLIAEFATHAPEMLDLVRRAVDEAEPDLGFLRLASEPWFACDDMSIDLAIMEKSNVLSALSFTGGWSDLGDWEAVWRHGDRDEKGVASRGQARAIACQDTLLWGETEGQELIGVGLDNIVAVAMADAVLVADKRRLQDVKQVVSLLRTVGVAQADAFPRDHRPWGFFETLILSDRFQVKRIVVNPGAQLSLQSHMHRAEHWIVVKGTAQVTIGDEVQLVPENASVFVPLGVKHRMENPGKVPMELIEIQTGTYLGEDDIIRYEDLYARGQGARG